MNDSKIFATHEQRDFQYSSKYSSEHFCIDEKRNMLLIPKAMLTSKLHKSVMVKFSGVLKISPAIE